MTQCVYVRGRERDMKHTYLLLALTFAAPAFGAATKTTCANTAGDLVYTRLDYVYGMQPGPELNLPSSEVSWKLQGEEYAKTETRTNGQSIKTGRPVSYEFDDGTTVELEQ